MNIYKSFYILKFKINTFVKAFKLKILGNIDGDKRGGLL